MKKKKATRKKVSKRKTASKKKAVSKKKAPARKKVEARKPAETKVEIGKKTNGANGHSVPSPVIPSTIDPTVATLVGPLQVDDHMHFSPPDLHRYELAQYKQGHFTQAIALLRAKAEKVKREADEEVARISAEIHQTIKESNDAQAEFVKLQNEVQEVYGINLKEVTYDDKTGRINRPNQ